jgi:hypothetical protein
MRVLCCRILTACLLFALYPAEVRSAEPARCILIEIYFRQRDHEFDAALAAVEELRSECGGITPVLRDVTDATNQDRLTAILRHYKTPLDRSPVIYGCNRIIHEVTPARSWSSQLRSMLRLEVFVRTGCSRCASAKQWLPKLMKEYPALELVYRDIAVNADDANRLSQLVTQHQTAAASVPAFHVCDRLLVGFYTEASTGERLKAALKKWSGVCRNPDQDAGRKQGVPQKPQPAETPSSRSSFLPARGMSSQILTVLSASDKGRLIASRLAAAAPVTLLAAAQTETAREETTADQIEQTSSQPDLPLPQDDMPEDDTVSAESGLELPGSGDSSAEAEQADDNIDVPVFGRLSASRLGMPLFTIAIGLIDGFNPCAMWILLFLLSILVNLKDRVRMLAIAGTFVVVSGLAYFAFMAAWLNIFALIGFLRPIQIGLAVMAILIGSVHIKDFFAFKQGLSLSIPESSKPGIYARVRRIVTAEHLTGAVAGAITLAVLVNIVELLCTAGLPAMYTNILSLQGYSSTTRYAYLALYILAYMFDDGLMVFVVVLTLSKRKLQESQGRWLKLVSGAAILLLGLIMLLKPDWLH